MKIIPADAFSAGDAFSRRYGNDARGVSLDCFPLRDAEADAEVYLWRQNQFRELGFGPQEAVELAVSDADLAQARYVIGAGCAPELALRILR